MTRRAVSTTAAPPAAGPTLKKLLAPEEGAGLLTVKEEGARSTVTLEASDLFKSGSATVNTSYEPTLVKITEALNKVQGRVRVVGHTDDQPIKSLVYSDNFALSRERAANVAQTLLLKGLDNAARLTWQGVGSSQPLSPGSDPESRARNRRVEIIHLRDQ